MHATIPLNKNNKKIVMLNIKNFLLLSGLVGAFLSPLVSAESKREVVLDNGSVEVVRLTYPAGTESGMHTHIHPNRVVYFVKGGTLKLVPEGKNQQPKVLNVADGDTLFLPAMTHNVKNIGKTEVVIVETELKAN